MLDGIYSMLLPLLTALLIVFLIVRLRFFAEGNIPGRWSFVVGGAVVVAAALWQTVETSTSYSEWFVETAYYWLDLGQWLLLVGGLLLMAVGLSLYSDHWQTKGEQIELRDRRLSVMENLQRVAREPYQLLQLLDISLKEILSELPDCAGAVFLLNRARRQLVLTASSGLTPEETALLEHYPFGRNLVSQTIELGEPCLTGDFELFDRDGKITTSRFRSALMLPLVSSTEKIGLFVLLSEPTQSFSPGEVRYLSPAIEWLAEKIKTARLTRELATARNQVDHQQSLHHDLTARLNTATEAFASAEAAESFCRSMVGLHGAQSVHLVGLVNGGLQLLGGSEPLSDLTENYKTALIDALDRRRPLIINQEAAGEQDKAYIAHSSLLYPIGDHGRLDALLFRREGGPFRVSESDLKAISLFARLARAVLRQSDLARVDITRRKGFNKILGLLRFDGNEPLEMKADHLVKQVGEILPPGSSIVAFTRQPDGSFRAPLDDDPSAFDILPGEGIVAETATGGEPVFVRGRAQVVKRLEEFQLSNREACYRLLGETQIPALMAAFSLMGLDGLITVVLVFVTDSPESEQGEWERLLTLAMGLYSMRLTMAELRRTQTAALPKEVGGASLGGIVNRLNNHLSALIGNAELGMARVDLPGEVRHHFESIVVEAESAAQFVRHSLGRPAEKTTAPGATEAGAEDINEIVMTFLGRVRISDNLYMVGGRPREIFARSYPVAPIRCPASAVAALCAEAVGRLASVAREDEVLTIAGYLIDKHVYLDLSRHGREQPAIEQIARFGEYAWAGDLTDQLTAAEFLTPVIGQPCLVCLDQRAAQLSYMSFKFPVSEQPSQPDRRLPGRRRLLAIDDQTVILDLITAMCQSLDYEIKTARSGNEGLKLAEQNEFDIILTDLAMPVASGLEVARRLKEIAPGVPVILVTGWEVTLQPEQLQAAGIVRVLHKPFRIEQLTEIVRSVTADRTVS